MIGTDNEVGLGEALEKARKRRYMASMAIPALVGVGVLQAAELVLGHPSVEIGNVDPTFAVIFSIVVVAAILWSAIWSHKVFDEEEERNVLWANTIGLYSLICLAMLADVLAWAHFIPTIPHSFVLMVGMVPTLGTFAWLKRR